MEGLLLAALPNVTIESGATGQEILVEGLAIGAPCWESRWLSVVPPPPDVVESLSQTRPMKGSVGSPFEAGRNRLYDRLFVRPYLEAASASRHDLFDRAYDRLLVHPFLRLAQINRMISRSSLRWPHAAGPVRHELFQRMQTGEVRWYATVLAAGSVTIVALILWG